MEKYIIIYGAPNSGKTTTASLLYLALVKLGAVNIGYKSEWFNNKPTKNKFGNYNDFVAILEFKGKKIFISTESDTSMSQKTIIDELLSSGGGSISMYVLCLRFNEKWGRAYAPIRDFLLQREFCGDFKTVFSPERESAKVVKEENIETLTNVILKNI